MNFTPLLEKWNTKVETPENIGAFAFSPQRYAFAAVLADVEIPIRRRNNRVNTLMLVERPLMDSWS